MRKRNKEISQTHSLSSLYFPDTLQETCLAQILYIVKRSDRKEKRKENKDREKKEEEWKGRKNRKRDRQITYTGIM